MKIRHKQSGVVLEVELAEAEELGREMLMRKFFINIATGSLYSAEEWEEVKPQPTWKDVTAECEAGESSAKGIRLFHDGADVLWDGGYRLTKISGPLTPHVAFIVEKQE